MDKTRRFSHQEFLEVPQYRLILSVPHDPISEAPSPEICGMQVARRDDVTTVNMLGNRVSMRTYDFGKIEDASGTGTGNFEVLPPPHIHNY